MGLVDIVFPSFLGNKEHFFKEEKCACVFGPQHMKGALQNQLSIGGQVTALPVDQKRLNLLCESTDNPFRRAFLEQSLRLQNIDINILIHHFHYRKPGK